MLGLPALKLDATRFTSSGGAGAPPPPTLMRLDVSVSAKRGDSSRSQLCVGTPTKLVTCSRSISSRARSGSHLYIITSFRPLAKHDSITGHAAGHVEQRHDEDEGGLRRRGSASSGRRSWSSAAWQPKAMSAWITARWVDTAPFGWPVVPDV